MAAQNKLEEILDLCLARLKAGENLESCLADYPAYAEELRPLLMTATDIRALPQPQARPAAVRQGRERMLAALQAKKSRPAAPAIFLPLQYLRQLIDLLTGKERWTLKIGLRFAATMMALALVLATPLTITASSQSLPDEPLYPVKRAWEGVRYALTFDPQARQELEKQFQERRQKEVDTLVDQGREATLDLDGRLESMGENSWIIAGVETTLTAQTQINGSPYAGARVKAQAYIQRDGKILLLWAQIIAPQFTPTPTAVPFTPTPRPTRPTPPTFTPTPWPTATDAPPAIDTAQPPAEVTETPVPVIRETPQPPVPSPTWMPTPPSELTPGPGPGPGPMPTPNRGTPDPDRTPGPWPSPTPWPTVIPQPTGTLEPRPTQPHPTQLPPAPTPVPITPPPTPDPERTPGPRPTQTPWPTPDFPPDRTPHPNRTPVPGPTPLPWPTPTPWPSQEPPPTRPPEPTRPPMP